MYLDLENRAGFVDARPEGKRDVGPIPGANISRRQTVPPVQDRELDAQGRLSL